MKQHVRLKDSDLHNMSQSSSSIFVSNNNKALSDLKYQQLNASTITFRDRTKLYEVIKYPGSGYFNINLKNASIVSTNGDYKIHISVKNEEIEKAWNIIIEILYNHKIASFKVHDGNIQGFQEGKNIVIYTDIFDDKSNENLDIWKELLRTINNIFRQNNISEGGVSCFRFGNIISSIPEPKFDINGYCYIRRSVNVDPICCGLCKKSEQQIIQSMSDVEKLGLFGVYPATIPRPSVTM